MKTKLPVVLVAVSFLSIAVPLFAHHSFQAEFDSHNCTDMKGTLTKVLWDNPHLYFYLDRRDASGKVTSWAFEGAPLHIMQRSGTHKVTLTDNIGKEVSVRACMAKSGGPRAAAEKITTPDGAVHIVGVDVEHGGRE
jgi:Family of unknown function (DUF6152)